MPTRGALIKAGRVSKTRRLLEFTALSPKNRPFKAQFLFMLRTLLGDEPQSLLLSKLCEHTKWLLTPTLSSVASNLQAILGPLDHANWIDQVLHRAL